MKLDPKIHEAVQREFQAGVPEAESRQRHAITAAEYAYCWQHPVPMTQDKLDAIHRYARGS